jgi:xanthosine utilization system XapX-like protein
MCPAAPVVAAAGLIAATVMGAAVVVMLSAVLGGHDPRSPFVRHMLIVCVITGRRPGDYAPDEPTARNEASRGATRNHAK